jgi:hypothetical protein
MRVWNSAVWAVVMLAIAVVLKGVDGWVFVGVLMALIVGAAGTDALLVRALPPDGSPGRASEVNTDEQVAWTGTARATG